MRAPSQPRRRNTAEEIRQLGASQSKARTRGFVGLVAGGLSACALLAAFLLLSRPQPRALTPVAPPETPAAELRAGPGAAAVAQPGQGPKVGARRPKDPIVSLARPPGSQAVRPAGGAVPVMRGQAVNLEDLARSLASQKKGAVQLCFERELKRDPRLRGNVMVRVTLEAPHRIGEVSVRDNLDRAGFTKCVRTTMKSLDFPPLSEDLTVELPFALKSPEF